MARAAHRRRERDPSSARPARPRTAAGGGVLQLQRTAGNRATRRLVAADRRVQRAIYAVAAGKPVDVRLLLNAPTVGIDVNKEAVLRDWFHTSIRPKLMGQFGYLRFKSYLTHHAEEYSLSAALKAQDPSSPTLTEINQAVVLAINTHLLTKASQSGHTGIGKVLFVKRASFPSWVKEAFDKNPVAQETGLETKQVHLRHFVMGSWFRALPNLFTKHSVVLPQEAVAIEERVAWLIPKLSPWSLGKEAPVSGDPATDMTTLAKVLHDFTLNLNAGEGPENTLIGFLSHGYSELSLQTKTNQAGVEKADLPDLVQTTIDAVGFVPVEARRQWVEEFDPIKVFMAMVNQRQPGDGTVPPDLLAEVMQDFAFQLGMDFMKRQAGLSKEIGGTFSIKQLQQRLFPLGQSLYALIQRALENKLDALDWAKVLNPLVDLAHWLDEQNT